MSRQEKRYYHRWTQMHAHRGDSPYLIIFQQVAAMPHYDEAALLESLPDGPFKDRFAVTKHQMQAHILRALRQYHNRMDTDAVLRNALHELAILYDKGLWPSFRKVFRRALRLAQQAERFHIHLELLDWQRKALLFENSEPLQATLTGIHAEETALLQRIRIESSLKALHQRIYVLAKLRSDKSPDTGGDRPEAILDALNAVTDAPPTDFVAAVCYHNTRGIAALLRRNYATAFEELSQARQRWIARTGMARLHHHLYLISMTNYFNTCFYANEMQAFEQAGRDLDLIRDLPPRSRIQLRGLHYDLRLLYLLNFARFTEGTQLIAEIDDWLKRNERYLDLGRRLHFWHNIALFLFFAGAPAKALRYVRHIRAQEGTELRPDILRFSVVLDLVLHYQTGDSRLLESRLRTLQRIISRTGGNGLTALTHRLIRQLRSEPAAKARRQLVRDAVRGLESHAESPPEFGQLEIRFWLESLLKGMPLPDYLREKVCEQRAARRNASGN